MEVKHDAYEGSAMQRLDLDKDRKAKDLDKAWQEMGRADDANEAKYRAESRAPVESVDNALSAELLPSLERGMSEIKNSGSFTPDGGWAQPGDSPGRGAEMGADFEP
jgi:hypothetical protein